MAPKPYNISLFPQSQLKYLVNINTYTNGLIQLLKQKEYFLLKNFPCTDFITKNMDLPGCDVNGVETMGNCGICGPQGSGSQLSMLAFISAHPLRLGIQGVGPASVSGNVKNKTCTTRIEMAVIFLLIQDLYLCDIISVG